MTRVGFTGTQRGLTSYQASALDVVLFLACPAWFHHGDCIGGDAAAHDLARLLGMSIVIHPPESSVKRAFCEGAVETRPMKPYLQRDHDIVDETDYLVAAPGEIYEVLRSGTWATIREARRRAKPIVFIWPDGTIVRTENKP